MWRSVPGVGVSYCVLPFCLLGKGVLAPKSRVSQGDFLPSPNSGSWHSLPLPRNLALRIEDRKKQGCLWIYLNAWCQNSSVFPGDATQRRLRGRGWRNCMWNGWRYLGMGGNREISGLNPDSSHTLGSDWVAAGLLWTCLGLLMTQREVQVNYRPCSLQTTAISSYLVPSLVLPLFIDNLSWIELPTRPAALHMELSYSCCKEPWCGWCHNLVDFLLATCTC